MYQLFSWFYFLSTNLSYNFRFTNKWCVLAHTHTHTPNDIHGWMGTRVYLSQEACHCVLRHFLCVFFVVLWSLLHSLSLLISCCGVYNVHVYNREKTQPANKHPTARCRSNQQANAMYNKLEMKVRSKWQQQHRVNEFSWGSSAFFGRESY